MELERWGRVKQIVNACLDMEPGKRKAHIAAACAGDPALLTEVESLLASYADVGDFLETSALDEEQRKIQTGRKIGNYQISETIAQGGMGAVYKAVRADDQYRKQVAIKLIRGGMDSEFIVRRFKAERQILANLDHPNIARLLDGGTTDDGQPYLVIEYVVGQPIDAYCDSRKLSTLERLSLFRGICSAVQYAHQNLVIHRDLKPGNILVTAAGVPKLLDFGIAKILDPQHTGGTGETTATLARMMTPEYASPEQLRGGPFSTATDVYSLGVVLYRLLTGHGPYRTASRSLPEIAKAVCEEEPEKPSTAIDRVEQTTEFDGRTTSLTPEIVSSDRNERHDKLRSHLEGDLDNILLKALRKEPERRYASVEQFSEDIRRYLEGLPVLARKDTLTYRTSKFVKRHKAGVAATALVIVALIAGILVTLREARIAREQAEIARAERTKAERRFNDVRKLANSLIFEIHDSIQEMPAATATRKLLLERALQYLDSLAKEASGDCSLQRELATAYQRIGLLQGSSFASNLGDTEGALGSFRKAIANWDAVAKANPTDVVDQLNVAYGHRILSAMFTNMGKPGAREQIDEAMAITDRLLKTDGANPKVRSERAIEYEVLSGFQDDAGALDSLRKELAIREDMLKTNPDYPNLRRSIAMATVKVGEELGRLGSREEALRFNTTGMELYQALSKDGKDARSTRELAVTLNKRADILMMDGRPASALEVSRRSLAIVEPMATADPRDVLLPMDAAGARLSIGRALVSAGKYGDALSILDRVIQTYEKSWEHDRSLKDLPFILGTTRISKGDALAKAGNSSVALDTYQKAIADLATLANDPNPPSIALAVGHSRAAAVLASLGKRQEASAGYRKALAILEPLTSEKSVEVSAWYSIADAYFGMGELSKMEAEQAGTVSNRHASWSEARDWYRRSAAAWRKVTNPGVMSPAGFACGNPAAVSRAIALCDAALARPEGRKR